MSSSNAMGAMSESPIRVLIVDDESLIRSAFRKLLEASDGFEVVGEARDGGEGIEAFEKHRPDAVLMDLQMAPVNGLEAIRAICTAHSDACILALTTFGTRQHIVAALRAGASGYLLKDSRPEQLTTGIRQAISGDMPLSSTVRRQLVDVIVAEPIPPTPEVNLTPPREGTGPVADPRAHEPPDRQEHGALGGVGEAVPLARGRQAGRHLPHPDPDPRHPAAPGRSPPSCHPCAGPLTAQGVASVSNRLRPVVGNGPGDASCIYRVKWVEVP